MSSENVEFVRHLYVAFSHGGVEAILEYLDPAVEYHMSPQLTREPRVFHGHGGLRDGAKMLDENFDDTGMRPRQLIEATGEKVVAAVVLHGRVKGTGETAEFELFHVWTLRDGRAVRFEGYPSLDEALQGAGANGSG
jgi:ketosteroid isomerase-like protein